MSPSAAPLPTIRRHRSRRKSYEAPDPTMVQLASLSAQQAEFLTACGWEQTDVTFRRSGIKGSSYEVEKIVWWKKKGREFPQHFAVWLERKGLA